MWKSDNKIITFIPGKIETSEILNELKHDQKSDLLVLSENVELVDDDILQMQKVLYFCERHAFVSPRVIDLSHSSAGSFPRNINNIDSYNTKDIRRLYNKTHLLLNNYSRINVPERYAVLIKRDVLEKFDLIQKLFIDYFEDDDIFDGIERIARDLNGYGYECILANHTAIEIADKPDSASYEIETDPVDYFADLIWDHFYQKPRILYSLYELGSTKNGSATHSLSLLYSFYRLFQEKYEIYVLVQRDTDKAFQLSKKYKHILYPDQLKNQTFHVAYSPMQISNMDHMIILSNACLKICVCIQDVIFLRSRYLSDKEPWRYETTRLFMRYVDGLVSISHFSLDDTHALFPNDYPETDVVSRIIYMAETEKKKSIRSPKKITLPLDNYYLCTGNLLKHKRISDFIEKMSQTKYKIIIIGTAKEGFQNQEKTIYGYPSGWLKQELVDTLKENATGYIFPSVYEGFGIPFLEGIVSGKPILASDTQVNREIMLQYSGDNENIYLFNSINEVEIIMDSLCQKVDSIDYDKKCHHKRTWKNAAIELDQVIEELLAMPINVKRIRERWSIYQILSRTYDETKAGGKKVRSVEFNRKLQSLIDRFPRLYQLYRRILLTIDKNHYAK